MTILLPLVVCWGIALTGLYRRLPAASRPGNKITFGLAIISLVLLAMGVLLLTPEADYAWTMLIFGFYGLAGGIFGMGLITLTYRTLGFWRYLPLLLSAVFLGFIVSGNEADAIDNPVQLAFIILTGLGWLLLGIALWTAAEDVPGPALPA